MATRTIGHRPGGVAAFSEPGHVTDVSEARSVDTSGIAAGVIAGAQAAAAHVDVGTSTFSDPSAIIDTVVADVREDEFGATAEIDETVLVDA